MTAYVAQMPQLLLAKNSPLSLDIGHALRHPGWMFGFLLNCRRHKVERIIRLLGKLLAKTWEGLDPLLAMAEARDLVTQRGFMHVYADQRGIR